MSKIEVDKDDLEEVLNYVASEAISGTGVPENVDKASYRLELELFDKEPEAFEDL